MLRRRAAFFVLLAALAGCGGGGSSSLPGTPAGVPTASGSTQSVAISIVIPTSTGTAAGARRPAYISKSTQSLGISINNGAAVVTNLSPGAPGCVQSAGGRTCNVTVNAPPGTITLSEKLYATTNGTGAVLSQGTTTAVIAAGKANTVSLTLDGVPAAVVLALANPTPTQGTAATIGFTATVLDASGAAIVGGDPFTSSITLTDSDSSGVTSLSKTTLASVSDAANLSVTYTGGALATPAVFSATAAGLTSAAVTKAMLTPQSTNTTVSFNDYTTYGFDNQRTKFNPNSTAITPASVAGLHLAWQATLNGNSGGDYNTQTQPVIATNIPGHTAVVIVGGGGTGNLYAYDALSGALLWQKNLGVEQYSCGEGAIGTTNFGIGGTVAYDAPTKTLYVVGNYNDANNSAAQNTLWHVDATTGHTLGSVNFAPTLIGPSELNFSHVSVTLGNGVAYVGTAATCDISSWRGRVAEISVPSMSLINTYFTVWNGSTQPWGGGGVWGYGGVSLDFAGNVFTGVGNTDNGTTSHGSVVAPFVASPAEDSGNGDALIALTSNLSPITSNHPVKASLFGSSSFAADLDLNGTPLIFKPAGAGCDTLAAIQGKSGGLYVYDTTRIAGGPIGSYQLSPPSYNDEFLGDPAYSPVTNLVYSPIPVGQGTLYPPGMVAINPGCNSQPTVAWHSTFGPDSDTNGQGAARSVPAASAGGVVLVGTPCKADANGGCNGDLAVSTSANATQRAAQSVRKPAICCNPPNTALGGAVWALDASSGTVLNGGKPLITTPAILRMPPTIDGNWVYILDNSGNLYGFTIDSRYAAIAAKYRAPDARSHMRWEGAPRIAPHP